MQVPDADPRPGRERSRRSCVAGPMRSPPHFIRLVLPLPLGLVLAVLGGPAAAKSWCAYPLFVHEWGVHVFDASGQSQESRAELLPAWFLGPASAPPSAARVPVRELPPDNGDRDLPVVHFYSPRMTWMAGLKMPTSIPVALEVGFAEGSATRWFPAVDALKPADGARPQLVWERLELYASPSRHANATTLPWVLEARTLPSMWVEGKGAAERFVFYEGTTREVVPLALTRAPDWTATRRRYALTNRGRFAIHDIHVVHREGQASFLVRMTRLDPGQSATFTLDEQRAPDLLRDGLRSLRAALVDPKAQAAPTEYDWSRDRCVMQRDPAVPFAKADGHALYAAEADLMLGVWGERFFGGPAGTNIVYREDTAALDALMPLAVYTDMMNFVVLHRAGLAVWSGVALP